MNKDLDTVFEEITPGNPAKRKLLHQGSERPFTKVQFDENPAKLKTQMTEGPKKHPMIMVDDLADDLS